MESAKSFKIVTLGCKVNQYESALLKESFALRGWHQAPDGERADVTVVNTCVVTTRAAHDSRQELRRAIRLNPEGQVAAVGCYAQVFPHELEEMDGVCLIAGNTVKARVPELLSCQPPLNGKKIVASGPFSPESFESFPMRGFPDRARVYLKVQEGCESYCSYCIVPFARGRYRSLPPLQVLHNLEAFSQGGCREVVLTGTHLGKYGYDLTGGINLTGLLKLIGQQDFPFRVRLSSIEPNEVGRELIEMVAQEEWLCRHFHIPLQSGDNEVLKRMNRHYTRRQFSALVEMITRHIPRVAIGVDVMAGFPGESPSAHENTRSLIRDLPFSYLHVFPFSPRPGTPAAEFGGQSCKEVIRERASALRRLGDQKSRAFYRQSVGKRYQAVVERSFLEGRGTAQGTTDNYLPVLFVSSENLEGELVSVSVDGIKEGKLQGTFLGIDGTPKRASHP